jgi:hypothetical protein
MLFPAILLLLISLASVHPLDRPIQRTNNRNNKNRIKGSVSHRHHRRASTTTSRRLKGGGGSKKQSKDDTFTGGSSDTTGLFTYLQDQSFETALAGPYVETFYDSLGVCVNGVICRGSVAATLAATSYYQDNSGLSSTSRSKKGGTGTSNTDTLEFLYDELTVQVFGTETSTWSIGCPIPVTQTLTIDATQSNCTCKPSELECVFDAFENGAEYQISASGCDVADNALLGNLTVQCE